MLRCYDPKKERMMPKPSKENLELEHKALLLETQLWIVTHSLNCFIDYHKWVQSKFVPVWEIPKEWEAKTHLL